MSKTDQLDASRYLMPGVIDANKISVGTIKEVMFYATHVKVADATADTEADEIMLKLQGYRKEFDGRWILWRKK